MRSAEVPPWPINNLRNFLHQKGLKSTRQRETVWSALRSLEGHHPSSEAIYQHAKKLNPQISWPTLYRTLTLLKSLGVIVERKFGNGHNHYEVRKKEMIHGHLVCKNCGSVREIKNERIKRLLKNIAQRHRFKIVQEQIEVWGLCAECQRSIK